MSNTHQSSLRKGEEVELLTVKQTKKSRALRHESTKISFQRRIQIVESEGYLRKVTPQYRRTGVSERYQVCPQAE